MTTREKRNTSPRLNVSLGFQFFTTVLIATLDAQFSSARRHRALFPTLGALLVWILPDTRGGSITALD